MTKTLAIVVPLATVRPTAPVIINELFQSIQNGGIADNAHILCCWDQVPERTRFDFEARYPFIQSFVNDKNRLNYSKNSNIGMRFAHKELKLPCLVANQDCVLPPWSILKGIMDAPIGICTPTAVSEFPEKVEPLQFIETKGKFSYHCPYFPLQMMEECGYIDEGLITFSDDDGIVRSLLAGFTNTICNIPVIHKGSFIDQVTEGSSMSGAYNMERLGIDHQRFRWKWSIPNEIQHENFNEYILSKFIFNKELMYVN